MSDTKLMDEIMDILADRKDEIEETPVEATPKTSPKKRKKAAPKIKGTGWEKREDGTESRTVPFSEMFWKPKNVPDHLVTEYRGYDTDSVPELYVPPPKEFERFSLSMALGLKPNIVGPTGCGKTLMVEYFAAVTGRPFLRIEHNHELDKATVFGQTHINVDDAGHQSTDFVPGILPRSMDKPTMVALDELSRATGFANLIYQRLFDRRELSMPEMKGLENPVIKPVEGWAVCATDNTKGNGDDMDLYSASNVQDASFINRFDTVIEQNYLTVAQEEKLIEGLNSRLEEEDIRRLAKLSHLLHAGFSKGDIATAFSPRNLRAICKYTAAGMDIKDAIELNYLSRVSKSEHSDVMECIRTVFGS
jgi:cobaltochelatase CobS